MQQSDGCIGGVILLLVSFLAWWLASPTVRAAPPEGSHVEGLHSTPQPQSPAAENQAPAPRDSQQDSKEVSSSPLSQHAPVRLSPTQQQLIGVTYGTVQKRAMTKTIHTVGRVEYDERKIVLVTLKTAGWVQDLYADFTGTLVKKGQPLFTIYSPDLVTAQEEYLLALHTRKGLKDSRVPGAVESAESLARVSRNRLRLWDLTQQQIRELEETGKSKLYQTMYSPAGGFVIEKMVYKGQRVESGMTLYKIADLSTIWVHADIYEYQLPFIRKGQEAVITLTYYPGKQWRGTVDYVYPYLDTQTRTNKVRFIFPNPELQLKPGMYADMDLKAGVGERLSVPESAILHSGVRKLVFINHGQGRLEPREVTLGVKADGYWEVLTGLQEGEQIATSGNFLIDSESKLAAAESMMGMMGAIGMGDWKMESAKPMEMGGQVAQAKPTEKQVGALSVTVSTVPKSAKLGDNTLQIRVKDNAGKPVADATINVEYTMDMPGMMIDKAEAKHTSEGFYEAPVRFTMAGPWGITISIQRPGQAEIRERFTVQVGG